MLERLAAQPWLGNVPELENWILRAIVTSQGPTLDLDAGEQLAPRHHNRSKAAEANVSLLKDVESRHILKMLEETGWVIEGERGAASRLGLHPSTLRSRMRKLGIRRSELRSRSTSASFCAEAFSCIEAPLRGRVWARSGPSSASGTFQFRVADHPAENGETGQFYD